MSPETRNACRAKAILRSTGTVLVLCAAFACGGEGTAQAQAVNAPAPPTVSLVDKNGYDVMSRSVDQHVTDLSIGSGLSQLVHTDRFFQGSISQYALRDNFTGTLQTIVPAGAFPTSSNNFASACLYSFSYDTHSECFSATSTGAPGAPQSQDGSTLTVNADGTFAYTARDGTVYSGIGFTITFTNNSGVLDLNTYQTGQVTRVAYPNGLIVNINWKYASGAPDGYGRIQSVTTNAGSQIKYNYLSNTTTDSTWYALANVVAINNAVEYCDPAADTCSLTHSWKSASYSLTYVSTIQASNSPIDINYYTITDQAGTQTRYTILGDGIGGFGNGNIAAIQPPTATSDQYTFQYCWPGQNVTASPYIIPCADNSQSPNLAHPNLNGSGYIYSGIAAYTREGQQYNFTIAQYLSGQGPGPSVNTQTNTDSGQDVNISASFQWHTGYYGGPSLTHASFSDGSNATYTGDYRQLITQYKNGQTATFDYTYDSRDNLLTQTRTAAAGSGVANIVSSAVYPTTCSNMVTCNKPSSVTDPNGNTTTYTYDSTHGGVLTVTQPADANGITPQVRYSYTQISAQYLNSSGTLVTSPNPIWVVSKESHCRSSAPSGSGCALAGDEVVKTFQYGPASGAQDLLVHGIVDDANGLALRTCFGYDVNGNKISETKPNANLTACP